jgi:hypothetical protein
VRGLTRRNASAPVGSEYRPNLGDPAAHRRWSRLGDMLRIWIMDFASLDRMIDELEMLLVDAPSVGWKPFWAKAGEVREAFKSGIRYPTKEQREEAWSRFHSLRAVASEQRSQKAQISDTHQLDDLINKLEETIGSRSGLFGSLPSRSVYAPVDPIGTEIFDWKPVWAICKEIQAIFSSSIRYPTKELRQSAWTRFDNLRNEASRCANGERQKLLDVSLEWRNALWWDLQFLEYSPLNDEVLTFSSVDDDEMKKRAEFLREAMRRFSANKTNMLNEHKQEIRKRIGDIKESHDLYWERRHANRDRLYRQRMSDALERIESNIGKNLEKKARAEEALAKVEANIEKLSDWIASAYSDDYRERHEGHLAEAESTRDSIIERVRTLEEWIEQDERRRSEISGKLG